MERRGVDWFERLRGRERFRSTRGAYTRYSRLSRLCVDEESGPALSSQLFASTFTPIPQPLWYLRGAGEGTHRKTPRTSTGPTQEKPAASPPPGDPPPAASRTKRPGSTATPTATPTAAASAGCSTSTSTATRAGEGAWSPCGERTGSEPWRCSGAIRRPPVEGECGFGVPNSHVARGENI